MFPESDSLFRKRKKKKHLETTKYSNGYTHHTPPVLNLDAVQMVVIKDEIISENIRKAVLKIRGRNENNFRGF